MKSTLTLIFLLFTCNVYAQITTTTVKGRFYLYIDDSIHLYVNGTQIFSLDKKYKATHTNEIELKPGGRVVAQLRNEGGPRGFMLLFVSSDFKRAIRFPNSAFKILLNPDAMDFSPEEFRAGRVAKRDNNDRPYPLPFRSPKSDWVWGDMDACTLAATITYDMFQPLSQ
jgi:hypothetical protein